jgi:phage repressor protein C with HTH and peptisase S24 domain
MSALVFQTARKAQYVILELALPGRPKINAGVLLLDPWRDRLSLKLRADWADVAGAEDAEVLRHIEADLRARSGELGGTALLGELEDTLSNVLQVSERRAVTVADFEKAVERLYARMVAGEQAAPVEVLRNRTHLPVYSLRAAAGSFGEDMEAGTEGWVRVPEGLRPEPGMFAARVVGRSMEPVIPDGSLCVFRRQVVGSRQGKLLLIQRRGASETGGEFTVKRYTSTKVRREDGWRHERIRLEPLNPEYEAWDLDPSDLEDGPYRVCGEFLRVVPFEEQ